MTRISKQQEKRSRCPRKHRQPGVKTGPKKDNLVCGYKKHDNALSEDRAQVHFIPKIK